MNIYDQAQLDTIASFRERQPSTHKRRLDAVYGRLQAVIDQFGSFESFDEAISETAAPDFQPAQMWAESPWLVRNRFMDDLQFVSGFEDPRLDLFIRYAAQAIRSSNSNFESHMFIPDTARSSFKQTSSAFQGFSFVGVGEGCQRLADDYCLVYPRIELHEELKQYRNDSAELFMKTVTRLEQQGYEGLAELKAKLIPGLDLLSLDDPRRVYLIGEAVSDDECARRLSAHLSSITALPMRLNVPGVDELIDAMKRNAGYVEFGLDSDLHRTLAMGFNLSLQQKNPAGAVERMAALFEALGKAGGHPMACLYANIKGSWASAGRVGLDNLSAMISTIVPESTRASLLRDLYQCGAAATLPFEAVQGANLSDKQYKVMHELTKDERYISLIKSNSIKRDLIESEFCL